MVIKYEKVEQKKPIPWTIIIIVVLVALVGLGAGYAFFGSHQAPVVVNNSTPAPTPVNNTVIVTQQQSTPAVQPIAVGPNGIISAHQANYVIINAGAPAHLTLRSYYRGDYYDIIATYDSNGQTEGTARVDAHTGAIIFNNIG